MEAWVVKSVLSDGSEVFDVHCALGAFDCVTEADAEELCDAINRLAL